MSDNTCRVCSASVPSALTTCSRECARVAYIADAIDRLIDVLEQGGVMIEVKR